MANNRFSLAKQWPAHEFCIFVIFSAVLSKKQQCEITKFQILWTAWVVKHDSGFSILYLNANTVYTDSALKTLAQSNNLIHFGYNSKQVSKKLKLDFRVTLLLPSWLLNSQILILNLRWEIQGIYLRVGIYWIININWFRWRRSYCK